MTTYHIWDPARIVTLPDNPNFEVAHLMTSSTDVTWIVLLEPDRIVLSVPTLPQIEALYRIGYVQLHGVFNELYPNPAPAPVHFPEAEMIHRRVALHGKGAVPYLDIITGFTNAEVITLLQKGYFDEGEEDMYSWATPVLEMVARYTENQWADRQADEIENGENFGAVR